MRSLIARHPWLVCLRAGGRWSGNASRRCKAAWVGHRHGCRSNTKRQGGRSILQPSTFRCCCAGTSSLCRMGCPSADDMLLSRQKPLVICVIGPCSQHAASKTGIRGILVIFGAIAFDAGDLRQTPFPLVISHWRQWMPALPSTASPLRCCANASHWIIGRAACRIGPRQFALAHPFTSTAFARTAARAAL